MSSMKDTLLEMGFSEPRVQRAVAATGSQGVEQAMEWLLAHADDASLDEPIEENAKLTLRGEPEGMETGDGGAKADGEAKDDENMEEDGALAGLSPEEKAEKVKQMEDKIKERRKERQEQDKKDALEKEKKRIQQGKELADARRRMEEQEMKKIVEQRKKEKKEEMLARQKVKAQIEKDKQARRDKLAGVQPSEPAPAAPAVAEPKPQKTRTYDKTRIQIRLPDGSVMVSEFGAKEQLSAVRLYIELNRSDEPSPFNLITSFPRKQLSDKDMDTPLDALDLVPSAVLIVSKK